MISDTRDNGADVAVSDKDDSGALRCMGTLRAKHTCVQYHQDKKDGDLLGAFSFRLKSMPGK